MTAFAVEHTRATDAARDANFMAGGMRKIGGDVLRINVTRHGVFISDGWFDVQRPGDVARRVETAFVSTDHVHVPKI